VGRIVELELRDQVGDPRVRIHHLGARAAVDVAQSDVEVHVEAGHVEQRLHECAQAGCSQKEI
jgi:hypothetical protein